MSKSRSMITRRMARSMTKIQKKVEDGGDNDRISSLPRDLIDLIMEFLPMRDIARTSVLSTKWRYVWAEFDGLVFDKECWNDIKRHKVSSKVSIDFAGIINRKLLHHVGNILVLSVDISVIGSQQHCDINSWVALACTRGVQLLYLDNLASDPYTVPSCVFSAPGLNDLRLSNCIIKTKDTCFSRVKCLTLEHLNLDSWVLTIPLLTELMLEHCFGARGFSISAPKLKTLNLTNNDDVNFIPFLMCTNITDAFIHIHQDNTQDPGNVNLLKVHSCWQKLTKFVLTGPCLKYLTTGIVVEDLHFILNLRKFHAIYINVDQIVWVLRILRNYPHLQKFICGFDRDLENDVEVLNDLDKSSIMNQRMKQLHTVRLRFFMGSKYELLLVKILLHCSPSLKKMVLEANAEMNAYEMVRILTELVRFPRASTKAEIAFANRW